MKLVKMLNSGTENLDQILNSGQSSSHRCGIGFNSSINNISQDNRIKFVHATVSTKSDQPVKTKAANSSTKTNTWVCHYCGKKMSYSSFLYALQRYKFQY